MFTIGLIIGIMVGAMGLWFIIAMFNFVSAEDARAKTFLRQLEAESKPHITGEL